MVVNLRAANSDDAAALLAVKQIVWPEAAAKEENIAQTIAEPGHVALVAEVYGQVAGFVDGFLTLSEQGQRRWEVDLLAVHPRYRQQGLAQQLVTVSTQSGLALGAEIVRALIHVENIASQHTFTRCGYAVDETICALWVASDGLSHTQMTPPEGAFFIPVTTFNYRGLWLEGCLNAPAFTCALAIRSRYCLDVAGAVIPGYQKDAITAAEQAGYTHIGDYQWWLFHQ